MVENHITPHSLCSSSEAQKVYDTANLKDIIYEPLWNVVFVTLFKPGIRREG